MGSGINSKPILLLLFILCTGFLLAQNTEQLWFEYRPSYSFPNDYKLAMRASYRTNVEDPRWRALEARFMPEKKLNKYIDLLAYVDFIETLQYEALSTSEIRLGTGLRWHFQHGKRISTGLMARIEFRNVYKQEQEDWTYTTRGRIRLFGSMPINQKVMTGDHILYATSFFEMFFQDAEDIQERYANRFWLCFGLGYKLNNNLKFEILYNRQDSKNTITTQTDEITKENIFLFCVRHQLNPPGKEHLRK